MTFTFSNTFSESAAVPAVYTPPPPGSGGSKLQQRIEKRVAQFEARLQAAIARYEQHHH